MDLSCTLYHTCLYEEEGFDVYPDVLDISIYVTAQKGILSTDERVTSPNDSEYIFSAKERLLTHIDLHSIDEITCQSFPDYIDLCHQHNSLHFDTQCHKPILPTHFEEVHQENIRLKLSSAISSLESGHGELIHTCRLQNLQLATKCWGPMQYKFHLHLSFKDKSERDIIKLFTLYRS